MKKSAKVAYKKKNALAASVRHEMVESLNQLLADGLDLGMQIKQAHWNVKGPSFIALHELFDKIAEELEDYTDGIAERIVQLGGVALGTVQIAARSTRLPPYRTDIFTGKQHIAALSTALGIFGTSIRAAIDIAARANDAGTADLFTEISRGTDKFVWFVDAHSQAD